ncbi:MAG: DUF4193 family protein [Acidimicrobiia bacterium]
MSDEEFEDAEDDAPDEDLDEEDLDDDALDDDIDVVDLDEALDPDVIPVVDGEAVVAAVVAVPEPKSDDDEEEDGLDLDEELHPDDVEAPLDALLKEKTAAATMEDEEEEVEEEEVELDDRGEGPTKIMPRRPGEFLCSSCFLVLPRTQLADEPRMLCRDCA